MVTGPGVGQLSDRDQKLDSVRLVLAKEDGGGGGQADSEML